MSRSRRSRWTRRPTRTTGRTGGAICSRRSDTFSSTRSAIFWASVSMTLRVCGLSFSGGVVGGLLPGHGWQTGIKDCLSLMISGGWFLGGIECSRGFPVLHCTLFRASLPFLFRSVFDAGGEEFVGAEEHLETGIPPELEIFGKGHLSEIDLASSLTDRAIVAHPCPSFPARTAVSECCRS